MLSRIVELAKRNEEAYFATQTDQDRSLFKVIVELRQYQNSERIYQWLKDRFPMSLENRIGNIDFFKRNILLPTQVLEDICLIDAIEEAGGKLGREFYDKKHAAICNAIDKKIPFAFLKKYLLSEE